MTYWLQGDPRRLVNELHDMAHSDLRIQATASYCRAVLSAAADMIDREINDDERVPLNWSFRDRLSDAWKVLTGRAVVLRYRLDRKLSYRFARAKDDRRSEEGT